MACAHSLTGAPPAPPLRPDTAPPAVVAGPAAGPPAAADADRTGAFETIATASPAPPDDDSGETMLGVPRTPAPAAAAGDDPNGETVLHPLPPPASGPAPGAPTRQPASIASLARGTLGGRGAATRAGGTRPTPARGASSRAGQAGGTSPFGSRMSVLSSLADVDSTTLLSEGLEVAGRYRVKGLIGKGGMGVVYLADDLELERAVALKVIRSDIAASPESLERFKREIQLSSKVTHRNVLRVFDLGESEGAKFLTMEYVQGEDLSDIVKREGRLPFARVMDYFQQICAGLGAAHEQGVIHRDLKPQNVMIDPTGRVLLTDFGLATVAAGSSAATSGAVMGTPYYMSPEQVRGEELDQRSDIYALGIMLYELLTGAIPFAGGNVLDVMQRRLTEPPRPVGELNPDLPAYVRRVIDRCLAPEREGRYATCEEILREIHDATEGRRRRRRMGAVVSVAALLVVGAIGASGWYVYEQKRAAAARQREPVAVLIADFENTTGDPTFDRTLEPMLKLALEGAGFISAYDRSGIRRSLGVRPPETLDERTARELAVKQGVGMVLSGAVARQGERYVVSVKATQAVTGNVVAEASNRTSRKEDVVGLATKLATPVRKALGDDTSDSAQRFAMETLSATSLDVVREYAGAMEALSRSRFDEALQGFSRAVERDPKFGLAYAGMAISSRNLDRHQDAEKYVREAIAHLDGMTDRERYRTRGLFYYLTSDYQACVKEYGDLVDRFKADAAARNNLALCLSYLREMPRAVEEMRQVVKILPNRALYKENLALYSSYGGDFATAEQVARDMPEPGLFGLLALAFAQLGQGQVTAAADTYRSLAKVSEQGASYTTSGLADLAVYQGRYADAARLLAQGAAADLASDDPDRAASKFAALAHVHALRSQKTAATAAADKALVHSQSPKIRLLAARVYVEAGAAAKARDVSDRLAAELQPEPRAYANVIDGLKHMHQGDVRQAIESFTAANGLLDTWIGHFELGRAYLAAGAFPQADSEFERCLKRRGEAIALFLDEEPSFGHFPPVYYYQGLVREGLKSERAMESFQAYLAIRGGSTEDPLVAEVRQRVPPSR